jgi:pyridoxal phosphate enzyme (YggS family)
VNDRLLAATIASNLAAVRSRVERAAAACGRSPSDVRLIAVSKTFGPEHVRAAFDAGQREFGENRVQEALEKIAQTAGLPIRWHLVGHLQSNKVRKAVGPFACIHSIDSSDLLRRVEAVAAESGASIEVLVQVDLAHERTKFGMPETDLDSTFDTATQCRFAVVSGLMVLPPYFDDPEDARPYFRRLRDLRDGLLARGVPGPMLRELSMGMSHDLQIAIEEGATMIRVGTAIFGTRDGA